MSKRTTVRIPDDLYSWLATRAQRERRTVSNLLIALLSEAKDQGQADRSSDRFDIAQGGKKARDTA